MKEIMRFNAALVERDLGSAGKELLIVDLHTGEIVMKKHDADVMAAFSNGCSAVTKELTIGREEGPNGIEFITISDYGEWPQKPRTLFTFWHNPNRNGMASKQPKHTGNKRQYVKLFLGKIHEMHHDDISMLIKLAHNADWRTGVLVDKKKKPLDFKGLLEVICQTHKCSAKTLSRRMESLKQSNAIMVDDQGRYVISRELLQKG